jgi:predicted Zn-dependent peptidase
MKNGTFLFLVPSDECQRICLKMAVFTRDAKLPMAGIFLGTVMARSGSEGMKPSAFLKAQSDDNVGFAVAQEHGCLVLTFTSSPERFADGFARFVKTVTTPQCPPQILETVKAEVLQSFETASPLHAVRRTFLRLGSGEDHGFLSASLLKQITPERLMQFHKTYFTTRRITLGVSGPTRTLDVPTLVQGELSDFPSGSSDPERDVSEPKGAKRGLYLVGTTRKLVEVIAGYPVPRESGKTATAFLVACQVLTTAIRRRIQEEEPGAPGPAFSLCTDRKGNTFGCFTFCETPKVAFRAMLFLLEEAESLSQSPLEPGAFQDAVECLKRARLRDFSWAQEKMQAFLLAACLRGNQTKSADEYRGLLQLSGAEVKAVAENYLTPQRFLAVAAGPEEPMRKHTSNTGLSKRGIGIHDASFFRPLEE